MSSMQSIDLVASSPSTIGPCERLQWQLDRLAELELAHSDRVVERYGQRAYEVVRECRRVANLASVTSRKLSGRDGPRESRRSDP